MEARVVVVAVLGGRERLIANPRIFCLLLRSQGSFSGSGFNYRLRDFLPNAPMQKEEEKGTLRFTQIDRFAVFFLKCSVSGA